MPVCLTGDVHHRSLATRDQAALGGSEPQSAIEYAEIVSATGVNATLFVTGRTVDEDPSIVQKLGAFDCIEVGGHNYGAFTIPRVPKSSLFFRGYQSITGDICPKWVQRRGIDKTIARLSSTTGNPIVSWRDHGFNNDRNTYELLAESEIRYISDHRSPDLFNPYSVVDNGKYLTEVPINTPPDHDHIEHGSINPPENWSDPFSDEIYSAEEWVTRVIDNVQRIDSQGGIATILAHPACMALVDEFQSFRILCEELSKFECVLMREVGQVG